MGTAPTFTLPVTSVAVPDTDMQIGFGMYVSGAIAGKPAWVRWASTTTAALQGWDANNDVFTVAATNPFGGGWNSGYQIALQGFYEAA